MRSQGTCKKDGAAAGQNSMADAPYWIRWRCSFGQRQPAWIAGLGVDAVTTTPSSDMGLSLAQNAPPASDVMRLLWIWAVGHQVLAHHRLKNLAASMASTKLSFEHRGEHSKGCAPP